MWSKHVNQRLAELRSGTHDFTGLRVPSEQAIARAQVLAVSNFHFDTPTPSVLPSEEGDILFLWHKAGWDVEIHVGPRETAIWAHERRTGIELSGSFDEHRAEFSALLDILAKS